MLLFRALVLLPLVLLMVLFFLTFPVSEWQINGLSLQKAYAASSSDSYGTHNPPSPGCFYIPQSTVQSATLELPPCPVPVQEGLLGHC